MLSVTLKTKIKRGLRWTIFSLLAIILLLLAASRSATVQALTIGKATHWLEQKTGTKTTIGHFSWNGLHRLILEDVYVEDYQADTLASVKYLDVNFDLWALFSQRLVINNIDLQTATILIKKDRAGVFNFDHLVKAFESPSAPADSNSSTAWEINLSGIRLQNIRFHYDDQQLPLQAATHIGQFETSITSFSLLNQYASIDQLLLKESNINIRYAATNKDTLTVERNTEMAFPNIGWTIELKELEGKDNRFSYRPFESDRSPATFDPADIETSVEYLQLKNLELTAAKIAVDIQQLQGQAAPGIILEELQTSLTFTPQELLLDDFTLQTPYSKIKHQTQLYYKQFADLSQFVDKVNMKSEVKQLAIHPRDIRLFNQTVLPANLNQPFVLVGKWEGSLNNLIIEHLDLRQPQVIQLQASGRLQELSDPDQLEFDLNVQHLRTSYRQLSALLPAGTLPPGIARWEEMELRVKGKGKLADFSAAPIHLVTANGPELHGQLAAKGLPDIDQATFAFHLDTLITQTTDWQGFVSDTMPEILNRLGQIQARGTYEGSIHQFTTDLTAQTALGHLALDTQLDFIKDYSNADYDGTIQLTEFDLGALLQDSLLGQFDLTANIKGAGLQPTQMDTEIQASLSRFSYKNYAYDRLILGGDLKEAMFYGAAKMKDQNLSFDFDGKIPVDGSMENLDFHLLLDTINLHRLNLYDTPLGLRGELTLDANQLDLERWRGDLVIRDFMIGDSMQYYQADSLVLKSKQTKEDQRSLVVDADFIHARLLGDYQLRTLAQEITNWADYYFPVSRLVFSPDTARQAQMAEELVLPTPGTSIDLELSMGDPSGMTDWLLPELKQLDTFHLALAFDPGASKWQVRGGVPLIRYGDYQLDSLQITSDSNDEALIIDFSSKEFSLGDYTKVAHPSIEIQLANQEWKTQLLANSPIEDTVFWQLGARIRAEDEIFKMHFSPDPVFNGMSWRIDKSNQLQLMENGDYVIESLHLRQGEQELLIDGTRNQGREKESIDLQFKQFLLQTLNPLFDLPPDYMIGEIYGEVQLKDLRSNLNYTTALELRDWYIDSTQIGDLKINATQATSKDAIQIDVALVGEKNNLQVDGVYEVAQRYFDLEGEIDYLTIRTFDPFLTGLIADSKGGLRGDFQLTGTPQQPLLKGTLKMEDASTRVEYTGTRYQIERGELGFVENKIDFRKWGLKDERGNLASLEGEITHDYFQDIQLGLNFKAKKFQFFNTTSKDNELFYGKLILDANVDINGTPEHPRFRINAGTAPQTQFFVVPLTDEQRIASDDYIIFGKPQLDSLGRDTGSVNKYKLNTNGLDLKLDLNLTDDAELQIIIDPITGDKLICKGNANLSVDMNEGGDVNIFGTYEVEEGKYFFSYEQLAKRQFQLLKNSRITFAGDPLTARMDISAAYQTRVPVSDLLENQLTEEEGLTAVGSQRIDVRVLLRMQGDLVDPKLTFDIELVGDAQGTLVDQARYRLIQLRNNPSELNTQVFGLLLFNSFIKENAGQSLSNAGQTVVWSSVSKLVSGKLNQLADQYLDGLSVNIDLDAYKAGVGENSDLITELEVGVSKKMFNDRLNVKVGGNFNVGGATAEDQGVATNFAGDFALEYALTPSGNYQLRVYRRSDFDALNQSNLTRSGAGFSLQKKFKGKRQKKK